ncbi:centromere protein L-like [Tachypleus tridentatus]|uniref:centromere protein L-like n=1 Tax=Tachypleus tridentatus TaxID=6853 RepID=UPI003FD3D732
MKQKNVDSTPHVRSEFLPMSLRARSHRHTPYSKTPRVRNLTGRTEKTIEPTEQVASNLKALVNKTWRIHKVSPLFQFDNSPSSLRLYSRLLKAHLEAKEIQGYGVMIGSSNSIKTCFSVYEGLASLKGDNEAVEIKIRVSSKTGGEKEVFCGILCCVEGSEDTLNLLADSKSFTQLPVLLTKGQVSFTSRVLDFIQTKFDCVATPLVFTPLELSWMISMWAGILNEERPNRSVQLVYSVPLKQLQSITYNIQQESARKIWNCIHDQSSDEMNVEQVTAFLGSLEKHFHTILGIDLSHLCLKEIATPPAAAHSSGKLKIFSTTMIHKILRHITCLSQEALLRS